MMKVKTSQLKEQAIMKLTTHYAAQLEPLFNAFVNDYMQQLCEKICKEKASCQYRKCDYELKIFESFEWFLSAAATAMFIHYKHANPITLLKIFKDAISELENDIIYGIAEGIDEVVSEFLKENTSEQ